MTSRSGVLLLAPILASFGLLAAACGEGGEGGGDSDAGAGATSAAATATDAATAASSEVLDELLELAAGFEQVATWTGGDVGGRFQGPNGLTVDVEGFIYLTEFQGGRVSKLTPDGELLFAAGELGNPIGVAVDREGIIYVSESGMHRVSTFTSDGGFRSSWGAHGSERGQFRSAMGIAIAASEVFVADFGNHRVQVFDLDGGFLREWGEFGAEAGQFNNPIGLQIGPGGNVCVVDSANERVQVFTQQGEFVRLFDDVGPGPQVISINPAGEFYIASPWAEGRVRQFSPDGALLGHLGYNVTDDERARMTNDERARVADLSLLAGPHGTATDSTGAVYLADTANGIVRKFAPVSD